MKKVLRISLLLKVGESAFIFGILGRFEGYFFDFGTFGHPSCKYFRHFRQWERQELQIFSAFSAVETPRVENIFGIFGRLWGRKTSETKTSAGRGDAKSGG